MVPIEDRGVAMLEITPNLDDKSRKPLYIQLSDYFKKEITDGNIKSKEKLPPKRMLASYLGLSINTIQAAFDQLCAEGYVESKPRKGLYVKAIEDKIFSKQTDAPKFVENVVKEKKQVKIDFNSGKVDLEHFPYNVWRKLTTESLYTDRSKLFNMGDPQGERCLREVITNYLYESRGVRCTADQIVIGAGTQLLIGFLCVLFGREHTYALENPGFHRTRVVLKDQGVKIRSISLDEDGISVNQLEASDATIVYVTPSHQFPCGMVMPISRRLELLKWAEERAAFIIEDDYDGEFRYKGKPIPSLQGLDTNGTVIYLGTFSKSLIPSLRISYLVLPTTLMKKYQQKLTIYKQTVSRLHQETLFHFMDQGHWQRHLNKMRTLYRKKQFALLEAIKKYLGDQVKVIGEKSGLHILIKVQNGMSEAELIAKAEEMNVKVYPTSIYYEHPNPTNTPEILLGYGGLQQTEIEEGIRLLKEGWNL